MTILKYRSRVLQEATINKPIPWTKLPQKHRINFIQNQIYKTKSKHTGVRRLCHRLRFATQLKLLQLHAHNSQDSQYIIVLVICKTMNWIEVAWFNNYNTIHLFIKIITKTDINHTDWSSNSLWSKPEPMIYWLSCDNHLQHNIHLQIQNDIIKVILQWPSKEINLLSNKKL